MDPIDYVSQHMFDGKVLTLSDMVDNFKRRGIEIQISETSQGKSIIRFTNGCILKTNNPLRAICQNIMDQIELIKGVSGYGPSARN